MSAACWWPELGLASKASSQPPQSSLGAASAAALFSPDADAASRELQICSAKPCTRPQSEPGPHASAALHAASATLKRSANTCNETPRQSGATWLDACRPARLGRIGVPEQKMEITWQSCDSWLSRSMHHCSRAGAF